MKKLTEKQQAWGFAISWGIFNLTSYFFFGEIGLLISNTIFIGVGLSFFFDWKRFKKDLFNK